MALVSEIALKKSGFDGKYLLFHSIQLFSFGGEWGEDEMKRGVVFLRKMVVVP